MWVAFRAVPSASGGRCLELDGVLAGITPAVPERSLPNSVLYETEDALVAALPALAEAYEAAGMLAWTVWVPEHHERARRVLADAGHELDATPTAMIAELEDVEAPRPDDPAPDPSPSSATSARSTTWPTAPATRSSASSATAPRIPASTTSRGWTDAPVASVVSQDHGGDCSIWWVAAVPRRAGRGSLPSLMRRALADGRARGCEVSTLQATKLGRPVYERLGYRGFGTMEMWEGGVLPRGLWCSPDHDRAALLPLRPSVHALRRT